VNDGGSSLTTIVVLAALALVPLLLMTATSFAKIAVVLSLLRNALGVPDVPSGALVTALAALLSVFVMAPVARDSAALAAPFTARIDLANPLAGDSRKAVFDAFDAALPPLRGFLKRNAGGPELALFAELARAPRAGVQPGPIAQDSILVLLPAFLITELGEAFAVGLLILLPFVVLDLVIASILQALGLATLTPNTVALPFKLLLFVLVDGFSVLSKALIMGYH
jgi:type III secretion protein R